MSNSKFILKKKIAEFYKDFHLHRKRELPFWIKDYWKYFKGKTLDIGCGKLVPDGIIKDNFVGLDMVFEAIKFVQEKGYTGIVGDGENLPFKNNYFETVACHDCLEHTLDTKKVLEEFIRVSKNKVIIFGPNYVGDKIPFTLVGKIKSILKIILGKHKHLTELPEPYLSFDASWDKDKDATTGINIYYLEKFFLKNNFKIKLSITYLQKKWLNYIPIIKYTGSFMCFVAERK